MPLQVRLRHAMGERVVEILPHLADKPYVIGRGAEAGLIVPSATVAPRQCVLFVHKNRWVVQEWAAGGTQLNGKPLQGPTRLSIGDILSFGADTPPPILEIDPAGAAAGKKGSPAIENAAASQPAAGQTPTQRPRPAPPQPSAAAAPAGLRPAPPGSKSSSLRSAPPLRPAPGMPAPVATPAPPAPAAEGDDTIDWGEQIAAASVSTTSGSRSRKRKKSSPVPMIIAGVLAVAIIGGTVWLVVNKLQNPPTVVIVPPPVAAPAKAPKPVDLFVENPTTAPAVSVADNAPDATPASPSPAASAAPTTPAANDDDPDSTTGDPDWTDVQVARDLPDPAPAIVRYDDYRRRNPGKHEKLLNQYEQESLDRLWWRRIAQLCHRHARLVSELGVKDKELAEESQASYKATLQTERAALASDLQSTDETLHKEMGYKSEEAPDLDNEQALVAARGARDPELFATWSRDIEAYVRRHSGTSPFGDEDQ